MLENLQETEKHIKNKLKSALTGKQEIFDEERFLFSLPIRDGGLNIILPEDRPKRNHLVKRDVMSRN